MPEFTCPCRVCPRCGHVKDDPEFDHPFDGLSSCYQHGAFHIPEWWSHVGPWGDGRHLRSESEREEWSAHDDLVHHGVRSGRLPWAAR